jgi:LysM repeat protein
MNNKFTNDINPENEKIVQKLSQVAEQTTANAQFASKLEERLRSTRNSKMGGAIAFLRQISPALRWAVLMILLGVGLSWSIKSLIPAPQPATANTPVVIETTTSTSEAVIDPTATPFVAKESGYDWRGTKLYLATYLPVTPAEANIYIARPEQPATLEIVRGFADQFGMQGEIFESDLEPNAPSAFSVIDGNQRLIVRSDRYFEYYPDYTLLSAESQFSLSNPNAEAVIAEFMKSHNFTFPYTMEPSELYRGFYVQATTPGGLPVHHEFFMQNGLLFQLNETQIVSVSGSLLKYDQVGTYGIKSAEEAFQQVVAGADFNGMIEGIHSSEKPPQTWNRSYPNNVPVTIYGFMNVNPSADGTQALVSIDRFVARGNLTGTENLEKLTLVKATGQFAVENDDQVFNVESWEVYKTDDHGFSGKDTFLGTLQKQGNDVVIVSETGIFIMPDVPAEVPLPLENAYVHGVALGEVLEWEGIAYFEGEEASGGGGSNGNGFYKLNLNGPPAAFPTQTATPLSQITPGPGTYIVQEGDHCGIIGEKFGVSIQSLIDANQLSADCFISAGQTLIIPGEQADFGTTEYTVQANDTLESIASNFGITVDELKQANDIAGDAVYLGQTLFIPGQQTENQHVGRRFEKQRGLLVITIYKQPDGSSRNEFVFIMKNEDGSIFHAVLENVSLEALRSYHNLPLDVWGTVDRVDQNGTPVINVERYEVPFPDLRIQLLQGTQRLAEVDGQPVILFTATDGTTYAQMLTYGPPDTMTILGNEGDEVILTSLAIPGESFSGYPVLYVFGIGMAVNANNQPLGMEITADKPYVVDEMAISGTFVGPAATIESVELVYYIPNSRYTPFTKGSNAEYIQPAWRFYGHYEDGDEFEILIQALKQEYLLPELAPFTRPG